jgi:AcrR family transcriptional regulator
MNSHSSDDQRLRSGRTARGRAEGERHKAAAKSAPRLRERFREQTRRAILAAAEQTLVKDGVQGAKMEAIAKAAGIAVGTVYNYFSDREQLISALLELRRCELLAGLDAVAEGEPRGDFATELATFIGSAFEKLEAHRALFRLLLHEELSLSTKPASKQTMLRELTQRADRLIALGVAEGALRADDARLFSPMLVGLMRGVLIHTLSDPEASPMRDAVGPVLRFFLEGSGAGR